jgi:branched-chain amino acid transport system substrate-binding protein
MKRTSRRELLTMSLSLLALAACSGGGGEGGGGEGGGEVAPEGDGGAAPEAAAGLTIGAVLPLSGQTATYGEESLNGFKMGLDKLSADHGFKANLVFKDNKGDSTETAKLVSQLIKVDKANIIVGAVASTNTLKGAKVAQENGVPMMTPASTNAAITERGEYISRICFIDPVQGEALARLTLEDLGKKKAVIIVDKASDYSVGLAEAYRKTMEAGGGEILSEETFTAGEVDFSSIITKVARSGAEVIFAPDYYGDVGPMLKQAGDKWKDIPVVAGDGIDSPDLYELMGDYPGPIYMSSHFAPDDTDPVVAGFVKDYKGRFGKTPGAMAALGYDAALAVYDAWTRAGSSDGAALKDAINSIKDLKGITGSITLNAQRNADKDVVILSLSPRGASFYKRMPYAG